MKIGVISDTHSLIIPDKINQVFAGVHLIIHCGDVCDESVLKQLKTLAPVKAVCGNMDDAQLRKKLPLKEIITVGDMMVGVCHGHIGGKDALSNAKFNFSGEKVSAVLFGHSHQAFNELIDGILYFNPGSPNDVVKAKYFSCGLLTVNGKSIKGEIVRI